VVSSIREEELLYVMQRVSSMRLREGTLWAAFTDDPSGNASLDKSCELPNPDEVVSVALLIA
jgi:hypothetical protein